MTEQMMMEQKPVPIITPMGTVFENIPKNVSFDFTLIFDGKLQRIEARFARNVVK